MVGSTEDKDCTKYLVGSFADILKDKGCMLVSPTGIYILCVPEMMNNSLVACTQYFEESGSSIVSCMDHTFWRNLLKEIKFSSKVLLLYFPLNLLYTSILWISKTAKKNLKNQQGRIALEFSLKMVLNQRKLWIEWFWAMTDKTLVAKELNFFM